MQCSPLPARHLSHGLAGSSPRCASTGIHPGSGRQGRPTATSRASAGGTQQQQRQQGGRARTPADLDDPAKIGSRATSSVRVTDAGGEGSLTSYMTLPVEQYFVLEPGQIRHMGSNRFSLLVPRINLLNIWLEPEVEILVTTTASPARVVLQAENCRIRGSDLIQNMKLDQRFCLRFITELAWASAETAEPGPSEGEIKGEAVLEVWSEVVPPFNLMPRSALEASCNVVMAGLVNTLLPLFVRKLSDDYSKWSVDPEYRVARASRAAPLAEPIAR